MRISRCGFEGSWLAHFEVSGSRLLRARGAVGLGASLRARRGIATTPGLYDATRHPILFTTRRFVSRDCSPYLVTCKLMPSTSDQFSETRSLSRGGAPTARTSTSSTVSRHLPFLPKSAQRAIIGLCAHERRAYSDVRGKKRAQNVVRAVASRVANCCRV